jgi:hypothetical protein
VIESKPARLRRGEHQHTTDDGLSNVRRETMARVRDLLVGSVLKVGRMGRVGATGRATPAGAGPRLRRSAS